MEKLKLFEAFAGYGSQALALKRYGIPFESVGRAEIDPAANKAYEALHGNVPNFGDVSKLRVSDLPDMGLFTYSFPCQDISNAGKQKGLSEGSGTRSSLLWECERIIEGKLPKVLMMENVKALINKKNKPDFLRWLAILEGLGYNNYYEVVNARFCGVPQNRERVFCVSIRRDVDDGFFFFDEPYDNGVRLKDILESEVDEKYYLSDKMVKGLIERAGKNGYINSNTQASKVMYPEKYFQSLCAGTHGYANVYVKESKLILQRGRGKNKGSIRDIAPCVTSNSFEQNNLILIAKAHGCKTSEEVSRTIRVGGGGSLTQKHNWDTILDTEYKIRRLTPKECFRLMGLSEEEIDKIQSTGLSDTSQYKLAGNSIVVNAMRFLRNIDLEDDLLG